MAKPPIPRSERRAEPPFLEASLRSSAVGYHQRLLKLAEKHSPEKLEEACRKALTYSHSPSYKSIKNVLVTIKEVPVIEPKEVAKNQSAWYYKGCQLRRCPP